MKSYRYYNDLKNLTALLILLLSFSSFAQDPTQSLINVSKITSWVDNRGLHDWIIGSNEFNGSYPKGLPVGVIRSEGILWGGLVYDGQDQKVRTNGHYYNITGCSPNTRLFRVRKDFSTTDLTEDAASFLLKEENEVTSGDIQQLKAQYQKDWDEWPADQGAPFYDVDKNGTYNPNIDIPGVPGALQTIWINYNDELSADTLYKSIPIGLEIHETYWAYTDANSIENVIYKKVELIYKGTSNSASNSTIDSMYICQFSDTDIGANNDDYVGTDTTLNLGYAYNSQDLDSEYDKFGLAPPAVGYTILQGVSKYTGNNSDSAIVNFKWRKGYKYFNAKPLTNAILHRTGSTWSDPYLTYNGNFQFYNLLSGYLPIPQYPERSTGAGFVGYGTYMLPGDPLASTGDIDVSPGDRRMWLMNGPFNMNLGDTAEVVIALVGGMGDNHLASVTNLKQNVDTAAVYFNDFVKRMTDGTFIITSTGENNSDVIPNKFELYQNYPNPFNPYTTINYDLPEQAFVSLIIFDVLGREVKKLVNEEKPAGKYSVQFDAGNLSSGVYFYKISFDNVSNRMAFDGLNKTMKLILIK